MGGTSRRDFPAFPYPPYDIQLDLMRALYDTLEQGQVGLFESPTGTGKTLSVICACLHWLEDHRKLLAEEEAARQPEGSTPGMPAWMAAHRPEGVAAGARPTSGTGTKRRRRQQGAAPPGSLVDEDGADLSEFLLTRGDGADGAAATPGGPAAAADGGSSGSDSEGAAGAPAPVERRRPQVIFCSRTHSQLSQFVGELRRTRFGGEVALVALGSRRQLCVNDQVAGLGDASLVNERCLELQRHRASARAPRARPSPGSGPAGVDASPDATAFEHVGGAAASRGGAPRHRGGGGGGGGGGCPFLGGCGGGGERSAVEELSEAMLATPVDVEELARMGRAKQACPYYAARRAAPGADVVLAPYAAVLQPETREALGLDLEGAVVVFDEAHNLLDAVHSAHSASVTGAQLASVGRQVGAYLDRFGGLLSPTNAQRLTLLRRVARALASSLTPRGSGQENDPPPHPERRPHDPHQQQQHQPQQQPQAADSGKGDGEAAADAPPATRVASPNALLFDLGLDGVNLFTLVRWVREQHLVPKIAGFSAAAAAKAGALQRHAAAGPAADVHAPASGASALHAFVGFLAALTSRDEDGRVLVEHPPPCSAGGCGAPGPSTQLDRPRRKPSSSGDAAAAAAAAAASAGSRPAPSGGAPASGRLRFVVLDAAHHVRRALAPARSVVLVSGTLAPAGALRAALFPDEPPARVRAFVCSHIVPARRLLVLPVTRAASGHALDLRHRARGAAAVVDAVGATLEGVAAVVPGGLVTFVPSFAYLEQLLARWAATGQLARLERLKAVFREPRGAQEVEGLLAAYSACALGHAQHPAGCSPYPLAVSSQQRRALSTAVTPAAVATGPGCQPTAGTGGGPGGALLLCVVGAKLSEGINFGDGLGRCVVVVGLPYPNPTDPELCERMHYLDTRSTAAGTATGTAAGIAAAGIAAAGIATAAAAGPAAAAASPTTAAVARGCVGASAEAAAGPRTGAPAPPAVTSTRISGREYYEDACMKAVNQCVGRVIRHSGDYAAVLLADVRWTGEAGAGEGAVPARVRKLPGWIQRSWGGGDGGLASVCAALREFYARLR